MADDAKVEMTCADISATWFSERMCSPDCMNELSRWASQNPDFETNLCRQAPEEVKFRGRHVSSVPDEVLA